MVDFAAVAAALIEVGLTPRGGFHPAAEDGVPALPGGRPTATLLLAGNVGPAMWQAFSQRRQTADEPHALDRWTRRVLEPLAETLGGHALFPFGGPPHLPFQRWAQRAEPVHPSPIGPLIHARHGLWHAYRGALVFSGHIELPAIEQVPIPCETCADKPCLTSCPVGALTLDGYDVAACAAHIAGPAGADCMAHSCRARRACPVGREYTYGAEQSRFHMAAFLRAREA
ncbi:MAG: hypothetical protein IIB67_10705 [Proteobacteria bacterium]|nr:hypothetical protein [Pseudomonadota bacterium]